MTASRARADDQQAWRRRWQSAGAAAAILTVVALFSGGAASPAAPLLIPPFILLVRYGPSLLGLAPVVAVAALLLGSALGAGLTSGGIAGAVAVLAGSAAGFAWRRDATRTAKRLAQLDDILDQTGRAGSAEARAAADELADLERAVASVGGPLGATEGTLWVVEGGAVAVPRVSSSQRRGSAIRLAGDPLGWAWEQGMRLRLDPTPRWAPAGAVVVADRLRRDDDAGDLITYVFPSDRQLPAEALFDQSAIYLRGVLALQEARATTAAAQRRVAALLTGLRRIQGDLDMAPLAGDLAETAMSVTDGTGALVGVWHGDRGQVLATAGSDGGPLVGDEFEPPASELAQAVRANAMLRREAGDWALGRTFVAHNDELWLNRPRSFAAVPLRGPAGVLGVLAVWSSRSPRLDPDSLDLLHLMSAYAALHLEHARQFGRLRETADRDPLTQLRNRRAFEDTFTAENVRFERYGRPLALLVLDIDHFKGINDRYGHEAGDEVLRRVAGLIVSSVRESDTPARLGGEEFVVLLPETGLRAATEVAERIRAAVSGLEVAWRGTPVPVRISIGVSAAPERVATPAELMASADAALYRAKHGGRDRVEVAQ